MDTKKLEDFLSARASDVPEYLCEVVYREHAGRTPYWLAISLHKLGDAIVEVAEDLRTHRADQRYAVITWYWRAQHYGRRWTTFDSLAAAAKHCDSMFRIDLVYSDIRA